MPVASFLYGKFSEPFWAPSLYSVSYFHLAGPLLLKRRDAKNRWRGGSQTGEKDWGSWRYWTKGSVWVRFIDFVVILAAFLMKTMLWAIEIWRNFWYHIELKSVGVSYGLLYGKCKIQQVFGAAVRRSSSAWIVAIGSCSAQCQLAAPLERWV